jgi:integrase
MGAIPPLLQTAARQVCTIAAAQSGLNSRKPADFEGNYRGPLHDRRDLHRYRHPDLGSHRPQGQARRPRQGLHRDRATPLARRYRDAPKTEKSKRTLALGNLVDRYRQWIAKLEHKEAWVFPQDEDKRKPMWDSGVRQTLKKAAAAEGCDFPGLGPHSFRRANITWRQEVGGSSIEASKIAGHASTKITEDYTVARTAESSAPDRPSSITETAS